MNNKLRSAGLIIAACLILAIEIYMSGYSWQSRVVAGSVVFLICCWGFQIISEGTAAILFFLTLAASNAVEPAVIFSGFTTPAFWLVFSGLIIGKAIRESGLSRRLASIFPVTDKTTYRSLLAKIICGGLIFSFFIPSAMGRIVILTPILIGLAKDCGFTARDKGYAGIVLAGILGTYMPPFAILPANLPNIVFAGSAKAIYDYDIGYMHYLLVNFPVLGLLKGICIWAVLCFFFPSNLDCQDIKIKNDNWSFREKGTIAVLLAALALWMLDSIHGISPGWISMGAAIILLLPLRGWFGRELLGGLKIETLLFVACAIGLGNIIKSVDLSSILIKHLLQIMPFNQDGGIINLPPLLALFMSTGLFTSMPSIPSIMVPLIKDLAVAGNMPLHTVLMLLVPAFSTIIFPYQAPPLVVGNQTAELPYRSILITCLTLALITVFILFPLDLLWWKVIGINITAS
jgi:di/tricarboxylate transporter